MYIDVHHHFNAPGGRSGRPDWSPLATLAAMDAAGVRAAIGWPGPVVAADAASARARARFLNEFGAGIAQAHPTRFGLFASLPALTDAEGALHEIAYAFDQLHADGIGLLTQYGDKWLGDPAFVPVFEELNRRAAVVFVHPTALGENCNCGALGYQTAGISQAWLEYELTKKATLLMKRNGVKMMAGSDAGRASTWVIPGFGLQEDFRELAAAGLSGLEILQMATLNPAEFLGRQSTMGTVDEGKKADLVLLDANPVDNPAHLGKIWAVFLKGRHYASTDLDKLKAEVATLYANEPAPLSKPALEPAHVH